MISLAEFDFGLVSELAKWGPAGVMLAITLWALIRVYSEGIKKDERNEKLMLARVEDAKEATRLINTATATLDKVVDLLRERGALQDKYQDWVRDRIEEFRNVPTALTDLKQSLDRLRRRDGDGE